MVGNFKKRLAAPLRLVRQRQPSRIGTCAECRNPVWAHEHYLFVRGFRIHRRCATYRVREQRSEARGAAERT